MNRILQSLLGRLAQIAPGGDTLRPRLHRWRGMKIGRDVWISQYVYIDELYPEAVTLGENSTLALRCSVFAHFHRGPRVADGGKEVVIEPDVFVGPHCVILPGVRIGRGSVIKAGTTVSRNIPPGVFWGSGNGEPIARVAIPLTPEHSYDEFIGGLSPLRPTRAKKSEAGAPDSDSQ